MRFYIEKLLITILHNNLLDNKRRKKWSIYLSIKFFADVVGGIVRGKLRHFTQKSRAGSLEETVAPALATHEFYDTGATPRVRTAPAANAAAAAEAETRRLCFSDLHTYYRVWYKYSMCTGDMNTQHV